MDAKHKAYWDKVDDLFWIEKSNEIMKRKTLFHFLKNPHQGGDVKFLTLKKRDTQPNGFLVNFDYAAAELKSFSDGCMSDYCTCVADRKQRGLNGVNESSKRILVKAVQIKSKQHKKRRWMTEAYHKRIQKKWDKRAAKDRGELINLGTEVTTISFPEKVLKHLEKLR